MPKYFEEKNPYALQSMTAVMMEAIRKGYWKADAKTQEDIAKRHAELVKKFGASCGQQICNNPKLRKEILDRLKDPELSKLYQEAINKAIKTAPAKSSTQEGQVLKEEKIEEEHKKTQAELANSIAIWIIIGIIITTVLAFTLGGVKRSKK